MPLDRDKLNRLHDYGSACASICNSAFQLYLMGDEKAAEELVRTAEDLLEKRDTLIKELLAPPP